MSGGTGSGSGFGSTGTSAGLRNAATEKQLRDALERIKELEDRLDQYEKKPKTDKKADTNNPANPIKGVIREVGKDGLLRISVGSDDGITSGQTLEVYRERPTPVYLGKIQVLEVSTKESVGRAINKARDHQIELDDLVVDRIVGK